MISVSYLHVKMKIFDNSRAFWLCSYFLYHSTTEAIRVVDGPVSVTEGDSANLHCELIETDDALEQVSWQKRTREIPENINFLVIIPPEDVRHVNGLGHRVRFIGNLTKKTGSIQLLDVSLQDEGVYTCIFTVFPSGPHQTEIILNVRVHPVVTVMPAAPLVVGSGSGILVTCTAANGRPAAEVSWRIDQLDGPVEIVKNTTQNPNGTTTVRSYLLVTPTRSMHGREVQCVVKHTALQHEDIVPYRISLHYAPQSVNITLKTSSSEDPTFQCDADANPAPTRYTWSRVNGEVLNPSIRPEGGRLVFLKMGSELNSLYVCEASNQYGQITGTLFVYTGVSRDYYGGLLAGILVLFCLLSICTRNTLFQQRNCSGSSSLQAHQEIEPLDVEEQELDIQGEGQQEVGMQDVEEQEVSMQDVEEQDVELQEVGMQDVELQEVGMQDVEEQEVGMQDVEEQEVGMQDVELQEVGMQDVELQEVGMQDVELQEVGMQDVELQEVGMQDVKEQELGIQEVELQATGLQDVDTQDVNMLLVKQWGVDTQEVEEKEVGMQEMEQLVMEQKEV
ncbi:nectin-1-like isoform X2 [Paramormyrops kingsleyae]|uniref:nectin-1-like isoform X2 n=1 Tax=Paramormyrops kingsleyae TaxID=1676925 RepID=UPI003B96C085